MKKNNMMSKINIAFILIAAVMVIQAIISNYYLQKFEQSQVLIHQYEEYYQVSQELIAAQELNNCLQDQIIKYYEYAEIPSQLQCPLPMAVR